MMLTISKKIVLSLFYSLIIISSANLAAEPEKQLYWDWKSIDTAQVSFPPQFMWGAAISDFQNSGATNCPNGNWAAWEKKSGSIKEGQTSGTSCDFWNRYPQDISLVKDLGLNSLRFSVEWSELEPQEGVWNEQAFKHYGELLDALIAQGISPMISLHHFTHPEWFEQKGGFEKEENIAYFLRFSQKVFDLFHDKVTLWCTFNEPGIYAFQGYIRGVFPPGYCDILLAGEVLKNLLKAHCGVYQLLKSRPGGDKAQIGIVHQHLIFEAYHEGNSFESWLSGYFSHIVSTACLDFFTTGSLKFLAIPVFDGAFGGLPIPLPLWSNITYDEPNASKMVDFIGLNYYSHVLMDWTWLASPAYRPDDIVTDMPYALYAEGLYRAIASVSKIGVPVYITENGIADAQDDRRAIFIQRYLYAISQAIKDGYDVRGYYYWTLMDNFEWDEGFGMKFGLYQTDVQTKQRTLRQGSCALIDIIKKNAYSQEQSLAVLLQPEQVVVSGSLFER